MFEPRHKGFPAKEEAERGEKIFAGILGVGVPKRFALEIKAVFGNGLGVTIFTKFVSTVAATDAAMFEAVERGFEHAVMGKYVVDIHASGLDLVGDGEGFGAVAAPNAAGEAKFGVIGEPDGFIDGRNGHDRQDRSECFFAHDTHVVGHIGQNGGGVPVAGSIKAVTASEDFRAPLAGVLDVGFDDGQLLGAGHRANIAGRGVGEGDIRALAQAQGEVHDALNQRGRNGFDGVDALDGHTNLTAVHKRTPDNARGSAVQIGGGQNDSWVFSSKFKGVGDEAASAGFSDAATRGDAAGEQHLVGVFNEGGSRRAITGKDLEDIPGETRVIKKLCDKLGDARRDLAGF